MLHIQSIFKDTIISNDIETLIVDEIHKPLNNLPMSLSNVIIKKQYNVFKRQHRLPYGCNLVVEKMILEKSLADIELEEEDYLEINKFHYDDYFLEGDDQINFLLDEICKMKNLRVLCLSKAGIVDFTKLTTLTDLKSLYLENNSIEEIPDSICNLINLKKLILYGNCIRKLNDNIGKLTNLKHLLLYENNIEEISESIGNLVNLEEL